MTQFNSSSIAKIMTKDQSRIENIQIRVRSLCIKENVLYNNRVFFSLTCSVKYFTQFPDHSESTSANEEHIYTHLCYVFGKLSSLTDRR